MSSIFSNFIEKENSSTREMRKIFTGRAVAINHPSCDITCLGDVGVEVELEGRNFPSQRRLTEKEGVRWNIVPDGSLRNNGHEFVMSKPASLDHTLDMIDQLYSKFDMTTLEISNRCSTHVHINIQGMRIHELTSFVCLWLMFEEAVVNWCGPERVGNLFCLRTKDSIFSVELWKKYLQSGMMPFEESHKYLAINFAAIPKFGSLEFRSMRAVEDPELLKLWVKFLYGLRELARNRFKLPSLIANEISAHSPVEMFQNICNSLDIPEFYNQVRSNPANEDFDNMIWKGFRNIQELIFFVNWYEIQDNIDKEYVPNPFSQARRL